MHEERAGNTDTIRQSRAIRASPCGGSYGYGSRVPTTVDTGWSFSITTGGYTGEVLGRYTHTKRHGVLWMQHRLEEGPACGNKTRATLLCDGAGYRIARPKRIGRAAGEDGGVVSIPQNLKRPNLQCVHALRLDCELTHCTVVGSDTSTSNGKPWAPLLRTPYELRTQIPAHTKGASLSSAFLVLGERDARREPAEHIELARFHKRYEFYLTHEERCPM